jgi:hypothetical protein
MHWQSLASFGKNVEDSPLLAALAEREEKNRNGKLMVRFVAVRARLLTTPRQTIVFIRDRNAAGQEVSGYIDFAHRLKVDDFEAYFGRKKRLLPRPSDLSFYNWETLVRLSPALRSMVGADVVFPDRCARPRPLPTIK